MNLSNFINNGINNIKLDSNLKQILILGILTVIVLGFGNKQILNPGRNMGGQAMGLNLFGSQGPDGFESAMNNVDLTYKKKKHRHHRKERRKVEFDRKTEVEYGNSGPAPQENINSPEVPYTVE